MNQKRSFVFLLLLTATLMVLSACGAGDEETEPIEDASEQESEDTSTGTDKQVSEETSGKGLDSVVSHFEENGFTIGEEQEKVAEMIGATDGFGIELDESQVEFYIYADDSSDLADIKENGEYDMEGFVMQAIANGNIVLMGHDEHPDEDKIVEVFNSY